MKLSKESFWIKTYYDNHDESYPTNVCTLFWYNFWWSIWMFTSVIGILQSIVWLRSKDKPDLFIGGSYLEKFLQIVFTFIYLGGGWHIANFFVIDYLIYLVSVIVVIVLIFGVIWGITYITREIRNKFSYTSPRMDKPSIVKSWWRGFKDKHCERIEIE